MANDYKIIVKIEDSFTTPPGHVWLEYQAPGQAPVKVGFYPLAQKNLEFLTGTSDGVIRDDSMSHWDDPSQKWTEPPVWQQREFTVSPKQFADSLDFMIGKAQQQNDHWVVIGEGNQCTGIARNGLQAAGIPLNDQVAMPVLDQFGVPIPDTTDVITVRSSVPSFLFSEVKDVPSNQVKGPLTDPAVEATIAVKMTSLQTLASHDELLAENARDAWTAPLASKALDDRIAPVGTVVIDESQKTPLTTAQATQNINNHLSPDGKEQLGVQISDGAGKTHSWQVQPDGSVERIAQENYGTAGSKVTVTTFAKGEVTPLQERQTVSGTDGIVSDTLLKPDGTGHMVLDKIQLGGTLDTAAVAGSAATPTAFNPATSLADYHGDTSNSYTVQKGDTVGSIAIKLGMTPAELGDYLKEQYGADANLNSIVAGRSLPVPADKLAAYKEASINGLDLPAEPASTTLKPDLTDEQASALLQDLGLPSNGPQQPGIQLADAGSNTVSDAGPGGTGTGTSSETNQPAAPAEPAQEAINSGASSDNPDSFTHYLAGAGTSLTPAQQDALASQLDKLGLGGDADLSFYALPDGGVLIGNAEGDIVGEINHSASGDLNLRATSLNADASAEPVSTHIREDGQTLSQSQYETQAAQQGVALFNSLNNLQSWDHLSDLGKLNAMVGLYNQIDGLGNAFGGSGDNLPGDLGAAAGWLSLGQGLQSGDSLIIANGLNSVSDGAIDGAINNALGSEGVPYLGYVLALRNFADDPEQAVGTMAGTYVGEIVGAYFGPVGSVIGGAIGGMLLQSMVQGANEQTLKTHPDIDPGQLLVVNPNILPRITCNAYGTTLQVTQPDGSSRTETINADTADECCTFDSFSRMCDGHHGSFLLTSSSGIAANQSQWRSVA